MLVWTIIIPLYREKSLINWLLVMAKTLDTLTDLPTTSAILRERFSAEHFNFTFGPDDRDYKIILEFHREQLRELYSIPTIIARPLNTPSRTYRHAMRVAQNMHDFARFIGFDEQEAENLLFAGQLHDIGKIDVPLEILDKPGKLSDEEFAEMKRHTDYGAKRIKDAGINHPIMDLAYEVALYHHERMDGNGYHKRPPEQIPARIRLTQICDIYDAISAKRPYGTARAQMSPFDVLVTMMDTDGFLANDIDRDIAAYFVALKVNLMDTGLSHAEANILKGILAQTDIYQDPVLEPVEPETAYRQHAERMAHEGERLVTQLD